MIKGIGIKKEGEVVEYYGITLADDIVGKGLKKGENGAISVDVDNLDINEEKLVKTTWAELKALRDEAKLVAGSFYRITDYVTTTTQSETKSANHPFDVVILALSENTLCEEAKATLHEGDEYFAHCDLSAWKLMYCLDNDKTRFAWADETNGKGVIYRMIDEKRNDCPYDFKNILFYNTKFTDSITSDNYYYTFSYVVSHVDSGVLYDGLYDGTTEKQVKKCYGNVMGEYRDTFNKLRVLKLNKNVFRNDAFGEACYSNTFGDACYSNTFGDACYSNTFGYACYSNTFGNYCYSNTFGNYCYSNTLGNNCNFNIFVHNCYYNTFGNECFYNKLGGQAFPKKFGDDCRYIRFEGDSEFITLSEEFYDDGSGQLVPTKHPDISTQPSILPYKFMGHYVYEQLIPISEIYDGIYGFITGADNLEWRTKVYLDCGVSAVHMEGYASHYFPAKLRVDTAYGNCVRFIFDANNLEYSIYTYKMYARVIYTSMPEEDSYYYQEDFFSNAAVIRLEGDYTSV